MSIEVDCHGATHVGKHRHSNEDQFFIGDLNKSLRIHQTSLGLEHQSRLYGGSQGKLLLVADGLGGHQSGDRASTLAVDGITSYFLNAMDWICSINRNSESDFKADLRDAFQHSQETLRIEAKAIPQHRGMATTLTMAYIDWPNLYVVHVGNTRCYHIRNGNISRITIDHTVSSLARNVRSEENVRVDEQRFENRSDLLCNKVLYNVIGGSDSSLDPQINRSRLAVGDSLLLCSDGLTRYLDDEEILKNVEQQDRSTAEICDQLIQLANDRGGEDNSTVVLARFVDSFPVNKAHEKEKSSVSAGCETRNTEFREYNK